MRQQNRNIKNNETGTLKPLYRNFETTKQEYPKQRDRYIKTTFKDTLRQQNREYQKQWDMYIQRKTQHQPFFQSCSDQSFNSIIYCRSLFPNIGFTVVAFTTCMQKEHWTLFILIKTECYDTCIQNQRLIGVYMYMYIQCTCILVSRDLSHKVTVVILNDRFKHTFRTAQMQEPTSVDWLSFTPLQPQNRQCPCKNPSHILFSYQLRYQD